MRPYYSWKIPYAKKVRTLMDDLGLRCYSTHNRSLKRSRRAKRGQGLNSIKFSARVYLILASVEKWEWMPVKNYASNSPRHQNSSGRYGLSAGFP